MSGVTKKIFEHEILDIYKMWNNQIKEIKHIIPKQYTENDIIELLKKFYPHEWFSVQTKYDYYNQKDKFLKKKYGKKRYNMMIPEKLIKNCHEFKRINSYNYRINYFENYNQERVELEYKALFQKRKPKIDRINDKIEKAKLKTQQVTPEFLDKLIGLYERKRTSQRDKMYIILELKKYYNPKIVHFFFKLNDTELNKQLREIAFKHLQDFNYQPRLRKQKYMQIYAKNKKYKEFLRKKYPNQTCSIPLDPDELEYRINNSLEQRIKSYDYFISHSSKDSKLVQELINHLNSNGKNVYCDWISDSDYLKRYLVRQATLNVIEKRLEQSKAILFVTSKNSMQSVWCKYELNYFFELGRPIYQIDIDKIQKGKYEITVLKDEWFYDSNYRSMELFEHNDFINIK